jgi:hypothetical protein
MPGDAMWCSLVAHDCSGSTIGVSVDGDYTAFFSAVAAASAALVGLLFVALSVSVGGERRRFGEAERARSAIALALLSSPLIIALSALIPDANPGLAATIVGFGGFATTAGVVLRLVREDRPVREKLRALLVLGGFVAVVVVEVVFGLTLLHHPHQASATGAICGALIGSLVLGIERAWELTGAPHSRVVGTVMGSVVDAAREVGSRPAGKDED